MAEVTTIKFVLGLLELCGLTSCLRFVKNEHGMINGHY